jgi:hypothetical protein
MPPERAKLNIFVAVSDLPEAAYSPADELDHLANPLTAAASLN